MAQRLEIEILGIDRASDVLSGVTRAAGTLGNIAKDALKIGLGVAATGFGALAAEIGTALNSAMESQTVLTQLDAVLESTGRAAGMSREALIGLADQFQKTTRFSDEAILSGENMLLTFTNIGKNVFPQATETILNMSTALGQDLQSSAIQLGKALQDPILGVTALRRVGVNFNEEQAKIIENLVKTNQLEEAQKLILRELATEFGGSAVAAGKTFAGQLDILKNQFDEVQESIGNAFIPVLEHALEVIIPYVEKYLPMFADFLINQVAPAIDSVIDPLNRFIKQVMAGADPLDALKRVVRSIFPKEVAETIVDWIDKIQEFGEKAQTAFEDAKKYYDDNLKAIVEELVTKAGEGITIGINFVQSGGFNLGNTQDLISGFQGIVQWVQANWPVIQAVALTVWTVVQDVVMAAVDTVVNVAWPQLKDAFDQIGKAFADIGITWDQVGPALVEGIRVVASVIGAILITLVAIIVGIITGISVAIKNMVPVFKELIDNIVASWSGLVQFFLGIYYFFDKLFRGDIPGAMYALGAAFDGLWAYVANNTMAIVNIIRLLLTGILSFIGGFVAGVIAFFQNLYDRLVGHSIIPDMMNAIRQVIQSSMAAIVGIFSNGWSNVTNRVNQLGQTIQNAITSALSKAKSLLSQFQQFGTSIIDGIIQGINAGAQSLIDTITVIVEDTITTVLEALEMHSPSQVFADIGSNMIKGMVVGMNATGDQASRGMRDVTDKLVSAATTNDYSNNWNNYGPQTINLMGVAKPGDMLRQLRDMS